MTFLVQTSNAFILSFRVISHQRKKSLLCTGLIDGWMTVTWPDSLLHRAERIIVHTNLTHLGTLSIAVVAIIPVWDEAKILLQPLRGLFQRGENCLEICQVFSYNDSVSISRPLSLSLLNLSLVATRKWIIKHISKGKRDEYGSASLFPYYRLVRPFYRVSVVSKLVGRRCPARLLMFSSVNCLSCIYLKADPLHIKSLTQNGCSRYHLKFWNYNMCLLKGIKVGCVYCIPHVSSTMNQSENTRGRSNCIINSREVILPQCRAQYKQPSI